MKFSIKRENLLARLQHIVRIIDKRQTMPILCNVLIQSRGDELILTGTDLEIQVVSRLPAENLGDDGKITLPGRKLLDICRLLPAGSVIKFDIDREGEKAKITSGRGRYSLNTLPADHYPSFPKEKSTTKFQINAGTLKDAIDKTGFCMASGDVRFYLNGIHLNISNSKIKMVASDGHRLSLFEGSIDPTGVEESIIVPQKTINEISRIVTDEESSVQIEFSRDQIRATHGDVVLSSKLIDSKYPDFSKVLNQSFLPPIKVNRTSLKEALLRVQVLANEKYKGVRFDISGNAIKLMSNNPDNDEAEDEVSIDYDGKDVSIAFNAQYIIDPLSHTEDDELSILIAENASACILEKEGGSAFKYISMPVRL